MPSLLEALGETSDVISNKDLVSSFFAEVAGPFSNSGAAEKVMSFRSLSKTVETETSQDSNDFKGMCMKKYSEPAIAASFPHFQYHFSAFYVCSKDHSVLPQ